MVFLPLISSTYTSIGLSYIFFRTIHILIDVQEGGIKNRISLSSLFCYLCSFLTLLSGPIQRFQDYQSQRQDEHRAALTETEVFFLINRIINGFLKIGLCSSVSLFIHKQLLRNLLLSKVALTSLPMFFFWICFFYLIYLYCNFSGYMDVVIGLGRFLGFQLPENFDRPFLSQSILEFWTRWHRTLADWFKVYVFNPIVKLLLYQWNNPKMVPLYGIITYFITFFLLVTWHGATAAMMLCGLSMGLGVSLNKLYEILLRRWLGKTKFTAFHNNILIKSLFCGFTLTYMSFSFMTVWFDYKMIFWITRILKWEGIISLFVYGSTVFAVGRLSWEGFEIVRKRFTAIKENPQSISLDSQFLLGIKLTMFFVFLLLKTSNIPEFVYKGF